MCSNNLKLPIRAAPYRAPAGGRRVCAGQARQRRRGRAAHGNGHGQNTDHHRHRRPSLAGEARSAAAGGRAAVHSRRVGGRIPQIRGLRLFSCRAGRHGRTKGGHHSARPIRTISYILGKEIPNISAASVTVSVILASDGVTWFMTLSRFTGALFSSWRDRLRTTMSSICCTCSEVYITSLLSVKAVVSIILSSCNSHEGY